MPLRSLLNLPGRSASVSPGGTCAARPSGILSDTVVPTVVLRSVPAFLPGLTQRILAPPVMVAKRKGIPLVEVPASLEGSLIGRCSSKRAVGDQSSPALKRHKQAWREHHNRQARSRRPISPAPTIKSKREKRAVGDQSSPALKRYERAWRDDFRIFEHSSRGQEVREQRREGRVRRLARLTRHVLPTS